MKLKRIMPSKKEIFNYWIDKIIDLDDLDLNDCWGCGFKGNIQRCHIHDRYKSNNDDLSNLVLLCNNCHNRQETMCQNEEGRKIFISNLIEGNLFFSIRFKELQEVYKSGIYNHLNIIDK